MSVGIEKLALYGGRFCVDALALAQRAGRDPEQVGRQLMVSERTVVPVHEDAVTLAVNAANQLLSVEDRRDVELVLVGTESGVDFSKSIATWVHRFCELGPNCFGFEVKSACYAATGALRMAATWVASGARPGKKALVVSTDFSHRTGDVELDVVGGGSAVAMLVSAEPRVLEIDLARRGYWTSEIADTCRPAPRVEIADGELSIYSYLDALDGAYEHYERTTGERDYVGAFKRHVYHAPFPAMTRHAHRAMLRRAGVSSAAEVQKSYDERVRDGIRLGQRLGTAYGASNFVSLLGHLAAGSDLAPGDRISFFAYGSGCQGELYGGTLGPAAQETPAFREIARALDERRRLTLEELDTIEDLRDDYTQRADRVVDCDQIPGAWDALYRGRRLLVLKEVKAHRRRYELS
jgi:hydroxymethylglutaryl-CoA synthase